MFSNLWKEIKNAVLGCNTQFFFMKLKTAVTLVCLSLIPRYIFKVKQCLTSLNPEDWKQTVNMGHYGPTYWRRITMKPCIHCKWCRGYCWCYHIIISSATLLEDHPGEEFRKMSLINTSCAWDRALYWLQENHPGEKAKKKRTLWHHMAGLLTWNWEYEKTWLVYADVWFLTCQPPPPLLYYLPLPSQ